MPLLFDSVSHLRPVLCITIHNWRHIKVTLVGPSLGIEPVLECLTIGDLEHSACYMMILYVGISVHDIYVPSTICAGSRERAREMQTNKSNMICRFNNRIGALRLTCFHCYFAKCYLFTLDYLIYIMII
jgi:hypothetical protein